jgi:hypothetical protein
MSERQLAAILEMSAQNPHSRKCHPGGNAGLGRGCRRPIARGRERVVADLKIFDGMCHDWQLYAPMLDEGMASIEEYTAFIKAHQA